LRVALTFDAEHPGRPSPGKRILDSLLEILGTASVRATFFMQGRWASAYPEQARAIAASGHLVGSHSHHHADMRMMTPDGFLDDLALARSAIETASGLDPMPWFRLPFGLGSNDEHIVAAIGQAGYRHVMWDCDSLDWRAATSKQIEARVWRLAKKRDESTVLFHTWPGDTPEGVRAIIKRVKEADGEFITVAELAGEVPLHAGVEPRRPDPRNLRRGARPRR